MRPRPSRARRALWPLPTSPPPPQGCAAAAAAKKKAAVKKKGKKRTKENEQDRENGCGGKNACVLMMDVVSKPRSSRRKKADKLEVGIGAAQACARLAHRPSPPHPHLYACGWGRAGKADGRGMGGSPRARVAWRRRGRAPWLLRRARRARRCARPSSRPAAAWRVRVRQVRGASLRAPQQSGTRRGQEVRVFRALGGRAWFALPRWRCHWRWSPPLSPHMPPSP